MPSNKRTSIFFLIPLLLVSVGIVWFSTSISSDTQFSQEKREYIALDEVSIPAGWYAHSLNESTILTRFPKLPDVGATEIHAYGDYILVSTGKFEGSFENIEQLSQTRWVFEDKALVQGWSKTKVAGYNALRVQHKAASASGKQLTYFIFYGDKFSTISLYSQNKASYINTFEQFVREYASKFNN